MSAEPGAFAIATFHSTHMVLKAEKLLKEAGVAGVRLVPVPSQVSSDCGVTVRFAAADVARAAELLRPLADDLQGIFVESNGGWVRSPDLQKRSRARGDGGRPSVVIYVTLPGACPGLAARNSPFGLKQRARVPAGPPRCGAPVPCAPPCDPQSPPQPPRR